MKTRHIQQGLLVLAASLVTLPALASDDCEVPLHRWQSRDAVMQMAAREGWDVSRLKIDDGCYELRGTDAEGRRFKAKLDPETLQPVKMKLRDKKDQHRSRKRDRQQHQDRQGESHADPSASTPFTPGTVPRGHIE